MIGDRTKIASATLSAASISKRKVLSGAKSETDDGECWDCDEEAIRLRYYRVALMGWL